MGTGKLSGKPDEMLVGNLAMDQYFLQGGEEILPVVPCYMETGISSAWVDRLVRDLQTYHIRLNLRV